MKVIRVIRCLECGQKYKRTQDSSEPPAPCPQCSMPEPPLPDRISAPAIVGTKSRAVDAAWQIAQEDFGLTDMRSNAKEGEPAFIAPPTPSVDPRTITRPAMLWGGAAPSNSPLQMPGTAATLASARGAAAMAKAEDRNPLTLLHRQRPRLQALPLNKT